MNRDKEKRYVIAHDVGTSSSKTVLLNVAGNIEAVSESTYPFQYPKPGWVEQLPEDYWQAVVRSTREVMNQTGIHPGRIIGMAFSTQAMGIIPMDADHNTLCPNITWVDGRAEEEAIWLMNRFMGRRLFKSLVGLEITGKDVIPKLIWLKRKKPEIYSDAKTITDVNGFLKFRATGELAFEWSGACSYAFNLKKKDWEHNLFRIAGIDTRKFPALVRSIDRVGALHSRAAEEMGLVPGIPVYGGCDDTQSAAVGTGATNAGDAHAYLGTSAWVGVTTSQVRKFKNGAVCLQSADPGKNLVVGITESAGNNLEWFLKTFMKEEQTRMGQNDLYGLIDEESSRVPAGSEHLIFTPWMLGERCPIATTTTRGTIFNLGLEHTRGHIIKAIGEGVGYNLKWIIKNFEKDFDFNFDVIRVTGGGSQNQQWMQAFADILQIPVETTNMPKMAGALGAAMCVLVGSGIVSDFGEVRRFIKGAHRFEPNKEHQTIYDHLFSQYKSLYFSLKNNYKISNSSRFIQ